MKGEGIFKNAQPTGLWKFYYENGQLKNEINYENGKAGIERCYDKEGHLKLKIVKREYLFESNLELCYDKNGNTWINTNYKKEKRFTKFEKLFLHILGTILIILISFLIFWGGGSLYYYFKVIC